MTARSPAADRGPFTSERGQDAPAEEEERSAEAEERDLRVRRPLEILAVAWGAAALVLGTAIVAAEVSGLPRDYFSRRPLAGAPCIDPSCFFAGLVSRVALMAWVACAAGCLIVALVQRRTGGSPASAGLLLWAGLLTAVMSLDEAFLLHDLLGLLVPGGKGLAYAAYAGAAGALLVVYRSTVRRTSSWMLVAALVLLAGAVLLDRLATREFIEDSAKLLGVAAWATYFLGTGVAVMHARAGAVAPGAGR